MHVDAVAWLESAQSSLNVAGHHQEVAWLRVDLRVHVDGELAYESCARATFRLYF